MVYGGGGPFGIAFGAGVAKGLQATGIPVASAPALGTSAGSWVAAIMALGLDYDDFEDIIVPAVPDRTDGAVLRPARQAFGDARSALVSAVAVCISGGRRGRMVLRGDEHDLAEICAASSAAPYLLPRHTIDGAVYVDGGVRSATSIGLAADADHVIVVAPLARGVQGRAGALMQFRLDREIRAWHRANPGRRLTLITPDAGVAAFAGAGAKGLFHPVESRRAHLPSIAQGQRWGEALQAQAARAEAGLAPEAAPITAIAG
jgi:NTE family protein